MLTIGLLVLWSARRRRTGIGLPEGNVVYADTGLWRKTPSPLLSRRFGLAGEPDYVVSHRSGVVPVEIKSGTAPDQPYSSHVVQLAAYCLLVEEEYGFRPPHGFVKYDDAAFEVDYTRGLEEELLATMDLMRQDAAAGRSRRGHNGANRCRACGYRADCDQRLK